MSTLTVWMILMVANSGHRVELPSAYATQAECLAAAQGMQVYHPGTSASCIASTITLSEERARQLGNEEWWRNRPRDLETVRRGP